MFAACALLAVAGPFLWPGALEVDGRALAELPEAARPAAVERLVARHGVHAAAPFLAPLLADADPSVRVYVARLLARGDEPAGVVAALDWVTSPSRPPEDRTRGLDVLGRAPTLTEAARRGIEQAVRGENAAIRSAALEELGRQDAGPSLSTVLGALDDADSRDVRLQAVRLVDEIARAHPGQALRAGLLLVARLDDSDRNVRLAALAALGALHDPRTVPALVRVATEQAIDLRAAAIDALAAPAMAAAEPTLIAISRRRPADELVRQADLALGEIATPAAVRALCTALDAPPVADEVKLALRHAGPAALDALVYEVAHGPPSAAILAAGLLGEIGDRRATPALAAAVDRQDSEDAAESGAAIVLVALQALARLRDPAAVPALARAAESPLGDVRFQALEALRAVADPRGAVVLDRALSDPDARVRTSAARLAGLLDPLGAAAMLAARLADDQATVRAAAARALSGARNLPPQILEPILEQVLGVLARPQSPGRDDTEDTAESDGMGDLVEALVTDADAETVDRAFLAAAAADHAALARAVTAAHRLSPLVDRAIVDRLIADLAREGRAARAAAGALAVARFADGESGALTRAVHQAAPDVRARLCAAIAHTSNGGAWLAAVIAAETEPLEVRAAAAWAARALPAARAALDLAAAGADGPLRTNASAALAVGARADPGWSAIRLRAPDGTPMVGRWVTMTAGGVAVDAMTDDTGVARVDGLADATAATWRADGLSLRAAP